MIPRFRQLLSRSFGSFQPTLPKFKMSADPADYHLPHPSWSLKEIANLHIEKSPPHTFREYAGYAFYRLLAAKINFFAPLKPGHMNEQEYLKRFLLLETVGAIPGMMGAMARHIKSVVFFRQDGGWIHHYLQEAENERVHFFSLLAIRKPPYSLRFLMLLNQAIFNISYMLMYLFSPGAAMKFHLHLEEEAFITYSACLKDMDDGRLPIWRVTAAPEIAKEYWGLDKDAKMKDVILMIRADEYLNREISNYMNKNDPKNAKIEYKEVKKVIEKILISKEN